MWRVVRRVLLATGLVLVVAVPRASAQIDKEFTFTTTFPFMVGKALLPAGSYAVRPASDNDPSLLKIEGEHHSAFFFGENARRMPQDPRRSEVIFDKDGDHYVLAKIWDEDERQGAESAAVDLAARQTPARTAPAANGQ